ncbi:hypothetical protein [Achromobacter sp. GD03932]|uniref:hypothetical protein n=1 Tax=Achromobacter sp. GD03932 TaxID=2975407 RepID=UPI0024486D04|nr:hypothetical protein [Achromobacter sp. GD03932]MDH1301889.1 hypothetical protein [Achromobacter sp. GD03932]
MHIAVFFDGVGLSIEEPSPLPSNVGRLFRGFGQGALGALLRQRVYISGLGTEMNVNAYEFAKDQAGSISGDMLKSVTLDPAKGVPTDAAKDVGMEILKGKRVGDAIGDTLKGLPGKVRRDVGEAVRNPGRTGVKIVKDAAGNITRAILDQLDPVRDSRFMFEAINSGVQPRISEGVTRFKAIIDSSQIRLEEIQVSVFGCDWGAALARAFLNELCKECDGDANSDKLEWTLADNRKVPLKMVFAGFYDAVGYRDNSVVGFLASKTPFGFLRNTAADDQELPRALAKAAHFISAHELRWRVHTLGGATLLPLMDTPMSPPARQERIYPGLGADLSGCYPPGFQQRDPGIGRVTLQEMWRIARLSGVPFEGLEKTKTNARAFGADFDIAATSRVRNDLRSYQQQLARPSQQLLGLRHAQDAIDGMEGDKTLARQLYLHRMVYVAWLRVLLNDARTGAAPGYLYITAMQAAIDFARLEIMHKHPGKVTFYGGSRISPPDDYQRACMEVSSLPDNERLPVGPAITRIFSGYMHDPVDPPDDGWAIQRLPNNARLFRSRYIDDGDDTRQPTFTEKLKKAADATFSNMATPNPLLLGLPF